MASLRATLRAMHITALGVWLGSLLMTGAAAAVIFPTLQHLNPALPGYSGYAGPHWKLAAGHVATRVFFIDDVVQFVCAVLALTTVLVAMAFCGEGWRSRLMGARLVALSGAITALSFQLMVLGPRMNVNLRQFWQAAAAGDQAVADAREAAFSADHPTAEATLGATMACVGVALVLSGFGVGPRPSRPGDSREPAVGVGLERPLLSRGAR